MIQVTVTGGKNLQERVRQAVQDRAEEKLRDLYREFTYNIFRLSPVHSPSGVLGTEMLGGAGRGGLYSTGAYISSHDVQFGSTSVSRGGAITSHGMPVGRLTGSSALAEMLNKIEAADFEQLKKATFYNNSPHAQIVEHGTGWANKGYNVYGQAASRMR